MKVYLIYQENCNRKENLFKDKKALSVSVWRTDYFGKFRSNLRIYHGGEIFH